MTDPVTWHTKYSAEEVIDALEFLTKHSLEFGDSGPIESVQHEHALKVRDYFREIWPVLEKPLETRK